MAAPPTPRLPAVVKVLLSDYFDLHIIIFPSNIGNPDSEIEEDLLCFFSQVAGATACLITILYFTYLLR